MKTIILNKADIHKGNLILINYQYPYHNNPDLPILKEDNISLEKRTYNLLKNILQDINQTHQISLVSGFRTEEEQTLIYKDSLYNNGIEFTNRYVALPQHSEHQTGLAIDLGLNSDHIDFIRPEFPQVGVCQNFRNIAYQYGFIQRYEEDKEAMTHIANEPWHFRYVGIPHSMFMMEKHLCLEEYIEDIKNYSIHKPLNYYFQNRLFSIFYVPILNQTATITLADNAVYQISGNNIDGFIVTVWRTYA